MAPRSEMPEKDYGPPIKYDPTFNGPIHRRSCTDIICLLLYIVFLICWGIVSWYALSRGDVRKLLAPTDSLGQKCGLDSQVRDTPHLVFFDMMQCLSPKVPIQGCPTTQLCVKKCPTETLLRAEVEIASREDIVNIRPKLVCKPGVNINSFFSKEDVLNSMDEGHCAPNVFKSKSISFRCIPSNFMDALNLTLDLPNVTLSDAIDKLEDLEHNMNLLTKLNQMGAMVIEDLVNAKWWIVLALFIVMLVCLIYITIMRWIAGPVVWFTLLAVVGLLSYSLYLSYTQYVYYRDNPVIIGESQTNLSGVSKSIMSMKETWLVILIAAAITLVIVLLMLIFLRKRIVLAIALIKEASRAVGSVKSTLFFPIFPWVFELLVLALAGAVCLYLATIGENNFKATRTEEPDCSCPYEEGQKCDPIQFNQDCKGCKNAVCHFTGITNTNVVYWMQAFNVAAFFWGEFFIQGVGDMILAGAFATWYWTFKKSNVPFFTLTKSIGRTLFYNLGTVAFGSLIITICRLIRLCLEYIDQKTKQYDNIITKAVLCCCKCFFACLESFLKFINKNAYIMCAIHGTGFISSAKNAFSLLMRNIVRVFVLDKVTDFLFFLSKLVVSVGCGTAAYFALTSPALYEWTLTEKLHYDLAPALIVGVAAYLIASVFFGVYSMAVDTLFLCFLEDCERNDGSPERPYFMSKRLMSLLGKKNK